MGCVMTVSDYIVKECLCTLVLTQFLAKVLPAIFAKTSQETCNFTGLQAAKNLSHSTSYKRLQPWITRSSSPLNYQRLNLLLERCTDQHK